MRTRHKAYAGEVLATSPFLRAEASLPQLAGKVVLEIGAGRGMFILSMAAKFPETSFLAIERDGSILAQALRKVPAETKNLTFFAGTAMPILDAWPDGLLDTIYLNFPDPWPKARHHKRRLVARSFLQAYERLLKDGGEVILTTDSADLFAYAVELVPQVLVLETAIADYPFQESECHSEYYMRFLGQRKIHRLVARKRTKELQF